MNSPHAAARLVRRSDGAELWATATGTGPPVVLLHGGPGLWDYLGGLAALLDDRYTVIRFDQRGCGRSTGDGPYSIVQAVGDVDAVRAAFGVDRWAVVGHSWGAELAIRYAARFPQRTSAVGYLGGIGAGDGYRDGYRAERDRRLGADLARWRELSERDRSPDEEHDWCILQWRPDFAPTSDAIRHAEALWATRPLHTEINQRANTALWADRATEDLLAVATRVSAPVTMIFGADDPRPWRSADSLYDALLDATHLVVPHAGHAPWVEQPVTVIAALDHAILS